MKRQQQWHHNINNNDIINGNNDINNNTNSKDNGISDNNNIDVVLGLEGGAWMLCIPEIYWEQYSRDILWTTFGDILRTTFGDILRTTTKIYYKQQQQNKQIIIIHSRSSSGRSMTIAHSQKMSLAIPGSKNNLYKCYCNNRSIATKLFLSVSSSGSHKWPLGGLFFTEFI